MRTSDDAILFHGPGLVGELSRFRRETGSALSPAVVLAPVITAGQVQIASEGKLNIHFNPQAILLCLEQERRRRLGTAEPETDLRRRAS